MKKDELFDKVMFFIELGFDCALQLQDDNDKQTDEFKKEAKEKMLEALKKNIASQKNTKKVMYMEKIMKINDPRINITKRVQKFFWLNRILGFIFGLLIASIIILIF